MPDSDPRTSWQKAVRYLDKFGEDGWWPYMPGDGPSIETTAWCLVAARSSPAIAARAVRFLISQQNADGGWASQPRAGPSDWSTGPAMFSLATVMPAENTAAPAFLRAVAFLMGNRTELYTPTGRILVFLLKGPAALDYPRGWPWTPGCFHWVEPTSYALIALKLWQPQNQEVKQAIDRGEQFLIEHACKGGGWNHGNNFCLDAYLPPYPVTTAEALVALADRPTHAVVRSGLDYLHRTLSLTTSVMSLSWAIIARDALGESSDDEIARLIKLQQPDGRFADSLLLTALAASALSVPCAGNPLVPLRRPALT